MPSFRYAVSVMPKEGILDPQGRAVELSLPHLKVAGVHDVRVGRRVELTVEAGDEREARTTVERLAGELFANPLIETWRVEAAGGASSIVGPASGGEPADGATGSAGAVEGARGTPGR